MQCRSKLGTDVPGLMGGGETFFSQLVDKLSVTKSQDSHWQKALASHAQETQVLIKLSAGREFPSGKVL